MPPTATPDRLLDAAEALFAAQGFHGTTVREITARADANLAAVHYHFGSRDALIDAVFARRLDPINRARLDALDAIERDGTPPLEALVGAFIAPPLRMCRAWDREGAPVSQLLANVMNHPDRRLKRRFLERFRPVLLRFPPAFERALPSLSAEEVRRRMLMMAGLMAHTLLWSHDMPDLPGVPRPEADVEATIARLVLFTCAGFRAGAEGAS